MSLEGIYGNSGFFGNNNIYDNVPDEKKANTSYDFVFKIEPEAFGGKAFGSTASNSIFDAYDA